MSEISQVLVRVDISEGGKKSAQQSECPSYPGSELTGFYYNLKILPIQFLSGNGSVLKNYFYKRIKLYNIIHVKRFLNMHATNWKGSSSAKKTLCEGTLFQSFLVFLVL